MATPEMDRNIATGRREIAPLRRFTPAVLTSDNVVPVVLEFEQPPVAVFKRLNPQVDATRYEAELIKAHQEFVQRLTALGMDVQVGKSNVVVAGANGTAETVTMTHDFTHVFNGLGVLMPGRVVANVAQMTGVRAVTLNQERVYLNAEKNIPFTGAPQVWERVDTAGRNIRGEGVMVAVIDTGVV